MSTTNAASDRLPAGADERVLATIQLRQTAWAMVEGYLRERHPEWTPAAVQRTTRERFIASTR